MTTVLRTIALAAASLALVVSTAAEAGSSRPRLSGEEQLAKRLKGRVPGTPTDCIFMPAIRGTQIIDRTAIVYDGGSTIWVNRPRFPESLSSDNIMVTRTTGSQLCRTDIVTTIDRVSRFNTGSIFLGQFVPYTRPRNH